jgi:hypothetical protein
MTRVGVIGRSALVAVTLAIAFAPSNLDAKPAKQKAAKAKVVKAKPKKSSAVFDADWEDMPATKYGDLDREGCLLEADSRGIAYEAVGEAPGVLAPIRLTGPLNGVTYHTELPEKDRATSPFEVFDCRLVLALHDFGSILAAHDVDEAIIFSAWRPPGKDWPEGKLGTRHPGALAVDIRTFKKRAGSSGDKDLVVSRDWTPARDKAPCGDKAPAIAPDTSAAKDLRSIYCAASSARIFNSMLGPNYNKEHENHFHLEVTPDVKWRMAL